MCKICVLFIVPCYYFCLYVVLRLLRTVWLLNQYTVILIELNYNICEAISVATLAVLCEKKVGYRGQYSD